MRIYIIEDDPVIISILEDIINDNNLGKVCGTTKQGVPNLDYILLLDADIVLIDLLMPEKDGIQIIKELKAKQCRSVFIMISQVASKDIIGNAYSAGVDFYINKPINIIEVKAVIEKVTNSIRNERTIAHIQSMLISETPKGKYYNNTLSKQAKICAILGELGMAGEKGYNDIIEVCNYLITNNVMIADISLGYVLNIVSDNPKIMEQRMRRAITRGLTNLSHRGMDNYMEESFTRYSGTLFPFEEVRAEMDWIRGKRATRGKINLKKFIDGLIIISE